MNNLQVGTQRRMGNEETGDRSKHEIKLNLLSEPTIGEERPNPTDGIAEIDFYLPDFVSNGEIVFIDLLGRVINKTKLALGYGTISVDTQNLPNGTYSYSLIVEGKVIDTKKMVRIK